ncbi:hypothetical protein Pint_03632 [Pistacia integerrima]|uniref:Uncharacterized protein n=1 Tax=Pistacia integerrima TaxID=434235 RepID=A0ACC0Z3J1_9ROSI|nr:hypothetical protein Pint_03632 [Pistacia integerrima]
MDRNLLSAFLRRLLNRLEEPSSELKHLAAVSGQKDIFLKLNQWSTMLRIFMEAIDFELNEGLLSNVEVKMWLDQVKELTDDMEEILDEISKQASRLNTRAVTSFDDENLSSRIIDITSQLEKLNTKRYALGLRVTLRAVLFSVGSRAKTIYGRDEDKEKILEMVLRDEARDHANFSVIPIIGTSRVGKTTLARLVYDDKVVEDFKPRAWVSLYENSNVFRICKAILESITSKSCNLKDLDEVLAQLNGAIFGRKFLFVLDDVSMEYRGLWETLKSSFMAGAPGSKILMTTHEVDIEFLFNLSIRPYQLEAYLIEDAELGYEVQLELRQLVSSDS